jgi:hypothetical protein
MRSDDLASIQKRRARIVSFLKDLDVSPLEEAGEPFVNEVRRLVDVAYGVIGKDIDSITEPSESELSSDYHSDSDSVVLVAARPTAVPPPAPPSVTKCGCDDEGGEAAQLAARTAPPSSSKWGCDGDGDGDTSDFMTVSSRASSGASSAVSKQPRTIELDGGTTDRKQEGRSEVVRDDETEADNTDDESLFSDDDLSDTDVEQSSAEDSDESEGSSYDSDAESSDAKSSDASF